MVRRGGALPLPRAGKSAKRRRWRMQRGDFEEVPRLAATTVAGNRLARRWAREPRPYGGIQGVRWFLWCVGEGLCPSRGRGNRRSAAGGGCSEAISRKCPDWRPQQWPGIGWHDGGQENPAPMKLQGVRCKSGRVVREADPYGGVTRRAVQIKGGPAGRPYGFLYTLFISYIHFLYALCGESISQG